MGIMNDQISLNTKGKGIIFKNFKACSFKQQDGESNLVLTGEMIVGDLTLICYFNNISEMEDFAHKHNIQIEKIDESENF